MTTQDIGQFWRWVTTLKEADCGEATYDYVQAVRNMIAQGVHPEGMLEKCGGDTWAAYWKLVSLWEAK